MSAKPIIPGYFYRVTGCGIDAVVEASDSCEAICIGLELFYAKEGR